MEKVLKDFKQWLRLDGKSKKTIENYSLDIGQFLSWITERNINLSEISREHILNYKVEIMNSGLAVVTVNKKINSLRSLNDFLIEKEINIKRVIKPGKDRIKIAGGSENNVDVYSNEELEKILSAVDEEEVSTRNKLIVYLLLYTGVRVSELVNIKISDFELLTGELKIVGKGNKYREIPMNQKLKKALKKYINTERKENKHAEDSPYLLLTERSPKMHRDTVNYVLRKICKNFNFKANPHKFRHTSFSILLSKGVDITTISQLAGHNSIETTNKYYLNTTKEEKAAAVSLL
ncbi:tyrosine-type recombinase/integrase [Halanaerobium salsuginis]|uniref:Integrase/recombinase XerD n=1 Tax=Halanaerobium salsuginis TaxID=29563 RepID=A0A1I4FXJ7_9FIRM|nr:tyrosine-type recombinase/integrase [Halanaerobium salsuginis]SFL22524.1 integrase/recombinase XerD [Halanaerobium salsuginis]